MASSLSLLIHFMLLTELIIVSADILSDSAARKAHSEGYPKISIVPSQFSEARLELSGRSGGDTAEYPSIRIALSDEVSAEISQPLPINQLVHGVVGERDVKMYASRLPHAGGGALKLFVQARGRPEPSEAAPLIVSVRTRDGGYTFTLPQHTKANMHHHSSPTHDDTAPPEPRFAYDMSVSRFMCPSAGERDVIYVTVGVGTSVGPDAAHVVYDYDLRLMELDADFWYLDVDSAPRGLLVTPVTPALFQYRWPPDRSVQAVRVAVASGGGTGCAADTRPCVGDDCGEEGDVDACGFLAVHEPVCPLTLTPAEILASARHLSFTRCGTLVVRRKRFPDGFLVSVFLQSDDSVCCPSRHCSKNGTVPRRKGVRVSVMRYEANFRAAAAAGLMGAAFIVIGLVSVCLRPVLARAAVTSSWEHVTLAKAISTRILGHHDAESFQIGLDIDGYEDSEANIAVHKNDEETGARSVKQMNGLKADSNAVDYAGDSQPHAGDLTYRGCWQSGTNTIDLGDDPEPEPGDAKLASTSRSLTDATGYSGSLQPGISAASSIDTFRTRFGSPQYKGGWLGGTSALGSNTVRSASNTIKQSGAINRQTDTSKYNKDVDKGPSFVHFSDTAESNGKRRTENDGFPSKNAAGTRQVKSRPPQDHHKAPKSGPLPAPAPRLVVLNPVILQVTCALLIAAFGISNVAIDVAAERRTGNFDRCFRNDLCCHDGQVMPDLNHLLSNVPYVGAGIGFLLAVYAQWHVYEVAVFRGRGSAHGVPHDFNLFTAIGAALAIEGVTSGLYHVCPNNRNSHIDFFFIYYLCAAMGMKLFQTRRGVTMRFHYTPAVLVATITLLGSLQQVPGMTPQSWQLAVVSTHFSSSFLWAAQMYLTGHAGLFVPWCWEITSDLRTRRLAAAHIVLNGGLALWGLFWPGQDDVFHSSTYALLYFSLNSGLYVCFYMIMKLVVCRERPPWLSVFNIAVGIASAVPALYFFVIRKPYNTNESPALSRTVNHPCVLFDFYDSHDVWHFLSASALFFLMLGVLTLDDDLLATPRDRIPVF